MENTEQIEVRAADIREGDEVMTLVPGCAPSPVGTALGTATLSRGFAHFRIGTGIHSWGRKHWPNTMITVRRAA